MNISLTTPEASLVDLHTRFRSDQSSSLAFNLIHVEQLSRFIVKLREIDSRSFKLARILGQRKAVYSDRIQHLKTEILNWDAIDAIFDSEPLDALKSELRFLKKNLKK